MRSAIGCISKAPDSAGQLHVLVVEGYPLGVEGTQVGVLEKTHEVGLCAGLEGQQTESGPPDIDFKLISTNLLD